MTHGEGARSGAVGRGDPGRRGAATASGLPGRLAGAARLDGAVYAELRGDTDATADALWLVALLGVAHAAGA